MLQGEHVLALRFDTGFQLAPRSISVFVAGQLDVFFLRAIGIEVERKWLETCAAVEIEGQRVYAARTLAIEIEWEKRLDAVFDIGTGLPLRCVVRFAL